MTMQVLYVVHPENRGVQAYTVPPNMAGPIFRHTVVPTPVFSREDLECATVEVCRVEPGTVCPHGWFCTLNLRTAQFIDELHGEREAVLVFLREHWDTQSCHSAASEIELGVHREVAK
jgi:hypothetical protein